jgi:hypothetical protein
LRIVEEMGPEISDMNFTELYKYLARFSGVILGFGIITLFGRNGFAKSTD